MNVIMTVATMGVPTRLRAIGIGVQKDLHAVIFRAGQMLRTRVRANASGRPGPNVITGNYRRSITVTNSEDVGGVPVSIVHTNAPQAMRLEYGFDGIDALGRRAHSRPYPHWKPATDHLSDDLALQARLLLDQKIAAIWSGGGGLLP